MKKILFILPSGGNKKIDVDTLNNSMEDYYNVLLVTENDCKSQITQEMVADYNFMIPFSAIACDRNILDYSYMGGNEKATSVEDKNAIVNYLIYCFHKFSPDYVISHVSDNMLSHSASLIADRMGVPFFAFLSRPFWPNRQFLVNPLTIDNAHIKKLVKGHYLYESISNDDQASKESLRDMSTRSQSDENDFVKYNKNSKYWGAGFEGGWYKIKNKINKGFRGIQTSDINRVFQFLYEKYFFMRNRVSPSKPYVFFPLHYQPEAAFLGTDNRFLDQAALCRYISYNIPIGIDLLIKEHPAQSARPISFYTDINRLVNSIIVSRNQSADKLIESAEVVITISSNAGFEALMLGKKVIVLGDSFYDEAPNVFKFDFSQRLDEFIESVIGEVSLPVERVQNYFILYKSILYENSVNISETDLIANSAAGIGPRIDCLLKQYDKTRKIFGDHL